MPAAPLARHSSLGGPLSRTRLLERVKKNGRKELQLGLICTVVAGAARGLGRACRVPPLSVRLSIAPATYGLARPAQARLGPPVCSVSQPSLIFLPSVVRYFASWPASARIAHSVRRTPGTPDAQRSATHGEETFCIAPSVLFGALLCLVTENYSRPYGHITPYSSKAQKRAAAG